MWIDKDTSQFKQLTEGANWTPTSVIFALLTTSLWLMFAVNCALYFHEAKVLHGITYVGFLLAFSPLLLGPFGLQAIDSQRDPVLYKAISIIGLLGFLVSIAGLIAHHLAA
ncbi:MAG: hypothetical protein ACK5UX_06610 [Burkholderiales bacterium]|jgi:hypothetical protein|nr:hypothetical protein [Nitrosomonadaceae bacterium]